MGCDRTPPPERDTTSYEPCPICGKPPTEVNMVECTKCFKWIHYSCAQVGDEVAEDSNWACVSCIDAGEAGAVGGAPLPTTKRVPKRSSSSRTATVVEKELVRTKKELELIKRERELLSLEKNLQMELQSISGSQTSVGSTKARRDQANDVSKPKNTYNNTPKPQSSNANKQFSHLQPEPIPTSTLPLPGSYPRESNGPRENIISSNYQNTNHSNNLGPTRAQLAARQTLGRDLPKFVGTPSSWPTFISSFRESTIACGFTANENLMKLQRCLSGQALLMVHSFLTRAENVPVILETLKMLYGRPELIIHDLINKIRNHPNLKADKFDSLISYAVEVQNLKVALEDEELEPHRRNPLLVQEILSKLPNSLQLKWAMYSSDHPVQHDVTVIGSWLFEIAMNLCKAIPTIIPLGEDKQNCRKKASINLHDESSRVTCLCPSANCIKIAECEGFKKAQLNEKWEYVKKAKLCRKCLEKHDFRKSCRFLIKCKIHGCKKDHHPSLHNIKRDQNDHKSGKDAETPPVSVSSYTHNSNEDDIRFRYVPVILKNGQKEIETYAFLDEGSSVTLLTTKIANMLALNGTKKPLSLSWTDESVTREENNSEEVCLKIKGVNETDQEYSLKARTISSMTLPTQSLNHESLHKKYTHLKRLPIKSYYEVQPEILIGLDNWRLAVPRKIKEGKESEPIAVKCNLGWTAFALVQDVNSLLFHNSKCCCDVQLSEQVKRFFSTESLGVQSNRKIESEDEKRANMILKRTLKNIGNRFEIGLLWKNDNIKVPESREMTTKRMDALEHSLRNKRELKNEISRQLKDYERKNYIRRLTEDEKNDKTNQKWYLPIFPVLNPNKPGKVRIVWDAAAKANNVSLNSLLLTGPDLTVSLLGVLFRFREHEVAVVGDIKEMFHQVIIREPDQQFQRFMWLGKEYLMKVMIFGSKCSPSAAQYVKNYNASRFAKQYPKAYLAITRDTYVDDWLGSYKDDQEAIHVALQVKQVHQEGGFTIRNWRSNSSNVLKALCEHDDQNDSSINLNLAQDSMEKVLGMWWCASTDTFTYSLKYNKGNKRILNGEQTPTKRELLRVLMSIYDPIGLIAQFTIRLKVLLQSIWRSKLEWDEKITDHQYKTFLSWLQLLPKVESLEIPRCYMPNFDRQDLQLHVFVDASQDISAAAAYFRFQTNGRTSCRLLAAKTHVAPLTPLSIPRLELISAVLGARLANCIKENHCMKPSRTVFWCDSTTVLHWINMTDPTRQSKFVAFRIAEIKELSDPSQWRYVPSSHNVVDDATKWTKPPNLNNNDRWYVGPSFLYLAESNWQEFDKEKPEPDITNEMKKVAATHVVKDQLIDTTRFSSWRRLRKTVAILFKVAEKCRDKTTSNKLNLANFQSADIWIYKRVQWEHYRKEIRALKDDDLQKRKSAIISGELKQLNPFLGQDGVLRSKSRIENAKFVPTETKFPIILPRKCHVTELIVHDLHQRFMHLHHETVINELRQVYHIPKVRMVLRRVRSNCQYCKVKFAKPAEPMMSPLPDCRLSSYTRPFTHTGMDFFGPLYVTVRRSIEKRYGVLFTCMSIRAVHIEIAYNLSEDECILAIKNFMSIRGQPQKFYCDRGTNFIAAERVLRSEIKNISLDKIAGTFEQKPFKFVFNPPASASMGGAWERLVRSIKTALYAIVPSRNFTDSLLRTCLNEAAYIVNARPLTYLPIESEESEALTPNHFLLGQKTTYSPLPVSDDATFLRKNYLAAQQFANRMWKRWMTEYLPDLIRRTKNYQPTEPIKVNDIVIICDNTLPTNQWPKARVTEVFMGKDGEVRSAVVKCGSSSYHRPISKLAKIDVHAKQ